MKITNQNFEKVKEAIDEQAKLYASKEQTLLEGQECLKKAKDALRVLKEKTGEI